MKKFIMSLLICLVPCITLFNFTFGNKYSEILGGINIDTGEDYDKSGGTDPIIKMISNLSSIAINLLIFVGVAVAMFGAYKIMSSDDEKSVKEGIMLVVCGVIGIIVMVSAKFISQTIIDILKDDVEKQGIKGIELAKNLYEKLAYPFIKFVLYFVVGVLFFIMVTKIIGFITSTDDVAKKKAAGIIIWTVVGILVMLGSKQMVETVMGKEKDVIKEGTTEVSEMGLHILKVQYDNIPIVYSVMNWIMGLSMFIVLVLIIVQAYRMITKPDDPKNRETMKKTILYIVIGVLVIGATYVISNVITVTG